MENETTIDKGKLILEVKEMAAKNARFCTATCIDRGERFEVLYHFELEPGKRLAHLRLTLAKDSTLPSISGTYPCATLIENEMRELFGLQIEDTAIDFRGGMFSTREGPGNYLVKPQDYQPAPIARVSTPCQWACPAGVDAPRYVRLVGEGDFDGALAVLKQAIPFPGILGRVCLAPCESHCRQGKQGEPIAIRQLKRIAYERGNYEEKVTQASSGKQVAIIGSGPAGLTAGYFLAKMGHAVTIFEALPEPGGMMRVGIPATELPRFVLDQEISNLKKLGVDIKLNSRVSSLEPLFVEGYQAVLLAIGAHQGVRRGVIAAALADQTQILKQFDLSFQEKDGISVLPTAESLATVREGVFAAGDVANGPTSVVHAISSAKKAVVSIDRYLGGKGEMISQNIVTREPQSRDTFIERLAPKRRPHLPYISLAEAKERGEEEVSLSDEAALAEGKRCWRCDLEE
jgi:hypothetical protein